MSDSDNTKDEQHAEAAREEESASKRSTRAAKAKDAKPDPWMVWKGKPGEHTPPLPSHDLSEGWVRVYITSMEEAEEYEKTGLWELHIPDGEIRKTRPTVESEG